MHASVMVLGAELDEVSDVLAPFDENLEIAVRPVDPEYPDEPEYKYNPDGKWDFWRLGGRFAWMLPLKSGADGHRADLSYEWRGKEPERDGVDWARLGDIQWLDTRLRALDLAERDWARWEACVDAHGAITPWPDDSFGADRERRDAWWEQPAIKAWREGADDPWCGNPGLKFGTLGRDAYLDLVQAASTVMCHTVIKGEGWIDPDIWTIAQAKNRPYIDKVNHLLDNLPASTPVAIVDIHS